MRKLLVVFLLLGGMIYSQQIGDPDFKPEIKNPEYKNGKGPLILIDEAHYNFHTITGRYKPFAELLALDGYTVKANTIPFTKESLKEARLLVISNPLNIRNIDIWALPTPPAFTDEEARVIEEWVRGGGSLFLISDHMPFPGACRNISEIFGYKMNNGFALDTTKRGGPDLFTRKDATLADNFITNGRNKNEYVDSIYSFTGQAIRIPTGAKPVLTLKKGFISIMPDTAWVFKNDTPKFPAEGLCQGGVSKYHKGKVAVWGEAAMFSAQIAGNNKAGMNYPPARNNYKLLLNIIHWLDGVLRE